MLSSDFGPALLRMQATARRLGATTNFTVREMPAFNACVAELEKLVRERTDVNRRFQRKVCATHLSFLIFYCSFQGTREQSSTIPKQTQTQTKKKKKNLQVPDSCAEVLCRVHDMAHAEFGDLLRFYLPAAWTQRLSIVFSGTTGVVRDAVKRFVSTRDMAQLEQSLETGIEAMRKEVEALPRTVFTAQPFVWPDVLSQSYTQLYDFQFGHHHHHHHHHHHLLLICSFLLFQFVW